MKCNLRGYLPLFHSARVKSVIIIPTDCAYFCYLIERIYRISIDNSNYFFYILIVRLTFIRKKIMKILATTELTVTKTVYTADYIESYTDGMPLSTTRHEYDSAEERYNDLKEYGDEMLDIDTSEDVQDEGWEFGTDTQTITTTVEVVENDDGTIIVRQKE